MAPIEMTTEEEATGTVKEIYGDVKQQLGIDVVPNLYRSMSAKPEYLEANCHWQPHLQCSRSLHGYADCEQHVG